MPSEYISQNEIDAAKTIHFDYLNTQGQPHLVWPPTFALARAYLDQLSRSNGLSSARVTAVRQTLTSAEKAKGAQRKSALYKLATQLRRDASNASDVEKLQALVDVVKGVASASR